MFSKHLSCFTVSPGETDFSSSTFILGKMAEDDVGERRGR